MCLCGLLELPCACLLELPLSSNFTAQYVTRSEETGGLCKYTSTIWA